MPFVSVFTKTTGLRITQLLVVGGALSGLLSACLQCNDIACVSGFEWSAHAKDSSPLAPGDYQLRVELDGEAYEVECTVVAASEGPSACTETTSPSEQKYEFSVSIDQDVDGDEVSPARGFTMWAHDSDAKERSGTGPRTVDIAVEFDDAAFFDVQYDVEYEVIEDYFGDPRCGSCELEESREYEWG